MLNPTFKKRYILTLLFNVLNSFFSFCTSIIVIRYLAPNEYGNYQFLFSIFVTIFTFSNLNTQNSYFTFISQKKESMFFYRDYLIWEFIQLVIVLIVSLGLYYSGLFDLFLGQNIFLVILALFAIFGTKNIREAITNTFESKRMSSFYLKSTFVINFINFLLVVIFALSNILSVFFLLLFIILEFFCYLCVALFVFWKRREHFIDVNKKYNLKTNINRYFQYAKPLFFSSLVASLYLFLERWLLQKFGGAEEQAYLSIALQFSTIILLLTTSILKIFWKEVAEYIAEREFEAVGKIFKNATENIFVITSLISIFFIFNAKEIITIVYGEKYLSGVVVFMLISFYTIHQTLGQLYGTFMLASENTQSYSYVSIIFSLLGIPLMFFSVAPESMFGLNLGAKGTASIMVFVQLLSVNTMGYIIKRKFGFQSMFFFQFKYLLIFGSIFFVVFVLAKSFRAHFILNIIIQSLVLMGILLVFYREYIKEKFFVRKK